MAQENESEYTIQDILSALQGFSRGEYGGLGGYNTDPLPQLLTSHDIEGVANYIRSNKCLKISILAGAGISVSAGIPDFRSKGGFYNTLDLSQYPLTNEQRIKCELNSEYILRYELFKENPAVYITARREMILAPEQYNATLSHWFIKLLYDKGLLKRYFSTNIDGLDSQIGLPDDIICNVHGTLAKAHCIECNEFVDMNWFRKLVKQQKYPIICPKSGCNGYVKPNTVLFGESLPDRYHELVTNGEDLDDVDLFIVIGTSLAVAPSNYLPQSVDLKRCVRLLVNRDKVQQRFDFDDIKSNDIWLKGNCDDGFKELIKCLKWGKDLYCLLPDTLKEIHKELLLDSFNNKEDHKEHHKEDNKDEEEEEEEKKIMNNKEQFIQSLLNNTSFMDKTEINRIWNTSFRGITFRSLILPIIHVQDPSKNSFDTVWKSVNHNIHLVVKYNFDGIILINHGFMCKDLVFIIEKCRSEYPKLWIGVNFLGCIGDELRYLIKKDLLSKVNALWIDSCGISFAHKSDEIIKHSKASDRLVNYREIQSKWMNGNGLIFGGIECDKNDQNINDYDRFCKKLASFASKGFMHCICTTAVGDNHHKIQCFKKGIKDKCKLAVSAGITAENVALYLDVGVDAIFVNKVLSDHDSFYCFNEFKMSKFRNAVQKYYDEQNGSGKEKNKNDGIIPELSPVHEEPANNTQFRYDEDQKDDIKHDNNDEMLYQIYISNANDVNDDLNGLYKTIFDDNKLPQIKHKTDSLFTPNFMYYLKSIKTDNEYGIFIIPSLEEMNIYKPTWVIAQIYNNNNNNNNKGGQQPIYYYASKVDFTQKDAMQIPSQCNDINNRNWLIVGDDGTSDITMKLKILKLKSFDQRRKNFSSMFYKKNKEKMKEEIERNKNRISSNKENKEDNNNDKQQEDPQIFDVDDHKISCVEEVGHDNILRVTDDIKELEREWNESELGNHDELEMFLGAIGKVIDIEEDDDTVKLEWSNNDCHWLPVKACWIKWNDKTITAPNFYPDQDEENDDSKLIHTAFGGDLPNDHK